jgi:hypothetical protein
VQTLAVCGTPRSSCHGRRTVGARLRVLRALDEDFHPAFGDQVAVLSVLWQNGVLGCVNAHGDPIFRETRGTDELQLPRVGQTYVLHPTVIDVLAVQSAESRDELTG